MSRTSDLKRLMPPQERGCSASALFLFAALLAFGKNGELAWSWMARAFS